MPEKQKPETALEKPQPKPVPVATRGGLMPRDYGELIEFAKMVAYSGMVPKSYEGNVGAVLVAVQMGAEIGLTPMGAIRSIAVINGMPSLWGDGMLALVVSHPDCEDVVETLEGTVATCTVKRRGRSPVTREFSWDDAKKAGLTGKKGPWQQYPKRMLQMRARSFALRDAFPDVLAGIRATEEALDAGIDMGAAEYVGAGPQQNPATAVPKPGKSSFGKPAYRAPDARESSESDFVPDATPNKGEAQPAPDSPVSSGEGPVQNASDGPDVPPWSDDDEPHPPSQADAEANGQTTLDGAGF